MNIDERIANLVAATAQGTSIEQALLRERVIAIAPAITTSPGTSAPECVVLATRGVAYFKRFRDQDPNACKHYRQDRMEVPLHEVAAWRLAFEMGEPWRQLLPTAVLRQINGFGGALINHKGGSVDPSVFDEARGQVMSAAFFDALIGNQDRNARNYRYDSASRRLGLIDHGFSFARLNDPFNASMFLSFRWSQPSGSILSPPERAVLERLLDSGDLHGLRRYLSTDRSDAVEGRARTMLMNGHLPVVSAF